MKVTTRKTLSHVFLAQADGKTYTAVIDSANVAYHKESGFFFRCPLASWPTLSLSLSLSPSFWLGSTHVYRTGNNTVGLELIRLYVPCHLVRVHAVPAPAVRNPHGVFVEPGAVYD